MKPSVSDAIPGPVQDGDRTKTKNPERHLAFQGCRVLHPLGEGDSGVSLSIGSLAAGSLQNLAGPPGGGECPDSTTDRRLARSRFDGDWDTLLYSGIPAQTLDESEVASSRQSSFAVGGHIRAATCFGQEVGGVNMAQKSPPACPACGSAKFKCLREQFSYVEQALASVTYTLKCEDCGKEWSRTVERTGQNRTRSEGR
jgi:hypothetical protein